MASIFSSVTSPSWGWIWFLIEAICIILVAIGCAGEVLVDRHKFLDKVKANPKSGRLEEKKLASEIKEWWKVFFGVIVVVGLSCELLAFCFSFLCSNREIEGFKSGNIAAAKQVEELRKQNDELIKERVKNLPISSMSAFVTLKLTMDFLNIGPHSGQWATSWAQAEKEATSARLNFVIKNTFEGRKYIFGKLDFVADKLDFSEINDREMEVSAQFRINPRFQPPYMHSSLPTIQTFMSRPVGLIDDIDSVELTILPNQAGEGVIEAVVSGTVILVFNSTPKRFEIPSQRFSNNIKIISPAPAIKK